MCILVMLVACLACVANVEVSAQDLAQVGMASGICTHSNALFM